MHVFSGRSDIVAWWDWFQNFYPVWPIGASQFDLDDGVNSWWYRGTGHDAHGGARFHGMVGYVACCNGSCDTQTWGFSIVWLAILAE
jgi:hypothetical protein